MFYLYYTRDATPEGDRNIEVVPCCCDFDIPELKSALYNLIYDTQLTEWIYRR